MKKIKKHRSKGFTLVELIVVIAILAVLAVGAVIAYGNIAGTAQIAAARSDATAVVTALNTARALGAATPNITDGVSAIATARNLPVAHNIPGLGAFDLRVHLSNANDTHLALVATFIQQNGTWAAGPWMVRDPATP